MKALTIWQPWASLLACGAKRYETRSWATKYRGPIAIHSGLRFDNSFFEPFGTTAHRALLEKLPGFTYMHDLPRGCIIATADLVGCYEISTDPEGAFLCVEWSFENGDYELVVSGNELLFGDYTPGRFAWELENVKLLPTPIPAKGHQLLWNWEV